MVDLAAINPPPHSFYREIKRKVMGAFIKDRVSCNFRFSQSWISKDDLEALVTEMRNDGFIVAVKFSKDSVGEMIPTLKLSGWEV